MSFKSAWKAFWRGKWTANRLMSRKWWALLITAGIVVTISYTLVAMLGIYSSTVVEEGLRTLRDVTIAYFSVNLVQKFIDKYRNGGNA
mgnify:CR=1 FL=1